MLPFPQDESSAPISFHPYIISSGSKLIVAIVAIGVNSIRHFV